MGTTLHLTESDFDTTLASTDKPVLVDFWAEWCPPCRALGPTIDRVAREQSGQTVVAKVDIDESQALVARFQVNSIPTLIVFKNGQVVDRMVGLQPHGEIVKRLAKAASK
ncbi:thioredoxin [Humisphaera borealis]|uniref:Thioredoxin n=1 Tax=Humisphaera borealis TaxID=2807512 RepID=A0A7M2X4H8_9BACT|nr:thioredoxin [Humisphaera borealis]